MKTLVLFIAVSLAVGAAALGAGYALAGDDALLQGGVAFALTFIPAALSLGYVLFSYVGNPEMRLMACLGSSGFRMFIAGGGAFFIANAQPDRFDFAFYGWLLAFYLGMLAFEIALIVRQQPEAQAMPPSTQATVGSVPHG